MGLKQQNAIQIDLGLLHLPHEFEALCTAQEDLYFELIVRLKGLCLVLEVLDQGKRLGALVDAQLVLGALHVDQTDVRQSIFVFFVFLKSFLVFCHRFIEVFLVEFEVTFLLDAAGSLPILDNSEVFY
jgi:hypothetical protein